MTDRRAFHEQHAPQRPRAARRFYHRLLEKYFSLIIPPGQRVLELGCGLGDLLAAVKPAQGVGVDFSPETLALSRERHPELEFHEADATAFRANEQFDYIVLSDLVNDVPDVQALLENVQHSASRQTRLVLNFQNSLWRPLLGQREQRWLIVGAKKEGLEITPETLAFAGL
jgi:SAM-dependent methyltransferase